MGLSLYVIKDVPDVVASLVLADDLNEENSLCSFAYRIGRHPDFLLEDWFI